MIRIVNQRCAWFILLWILAETAAHAQIRLGLSEAIDLGLKNRYDVQANQLNLALSENSIQKSRNAWLPELTVSGNVRYNTQLQTTVLPAGTFGNGESQRLTFGTRNNTSFALDLTQPIYKPEARTDLKISENNLALEQEKHNQKRTNVKIEIAEAYLTGLLTDIQRTLAQADEQRYKAYYILAEGKYQLGTLLESEYLTAKLDYQNSQLSAQKAEQNYLSAISSLCHEVNIPSDTRLILTDRIDAQHIAHYQQLNPEGSNERTEIRQLKIQQAGYNLQTRKVLDGLKPTVSVYGNYSTQFQYNQFDYFTNPWNTYNYLGLTLTVPLTAQFTRKTDLRTYQLYAQQTALTLKQTEADRLNDVNKTQVDFTNAVINLQSSQASLELAKQLHQIQQDKYELGTLLYSQVLDTGKSLQTAEQNYLEAAYSYLVARLNYEKAIGKY